MKAPTVTVFIPARDEEDAITETLRRLHTMCAHNTTVRYRTVLINDGSCDHTVARAQSAGVDHVVHHAQSRGLGAATRSGLLDAWRTGSDAAVKLDADGQYDPADIPRVVAPLLADEADLVWGVRSVYRYQMPFVRRVGNRVFSALTRAVTGWPIHDAQTGLMAFSRRFVDGFTLLADYNPPQALLYDGARRGMRYAEVPIAVATRTTGRSFVSWRYPARVLVNLARHRLAER